MPGDEPARWLRVHQPAAPKAARPAREVDASRVRIEAGVDTFGWLWAVRTRGSQEPDRTQTRLLSAAADQLGQALAQDRLAAEAQASEIARRSDDLRSALLQSVSHDLRTPLGTIRAAAGTLRPTSPLNDHERAESAAAIEREVEYLNRLVTNLLDLSRIEAGVLRPERDVFDLDDLAGRTIERLRPRLEGHPLEWAIGPQPVDVDPIFVDEALTNAIENVVKHTPPGTPIRIVSQALDGERLVRLTVEDAGPGVPDGTFERLFERFYRTPRGQGGSRAGTGIGLAVARGLVEATGGRVGARRSELGGLAVDFDLPIAIVPADLAAAR
jgi:two-component system sensor histidine kinase KdpD